VDVVETAILTEREFWFAWDALLRAFKADDHGYLSRHFPADACAHMETFV
jgi:hypothetical protein